jgi:hypothetical protein
MSTIEEDDMTIKLLRSGTRAMKNARFLGEQARLLLAAGTPVPDFLHRIPMRDLTRLHRVGDPASLVDDPQLQPLLRAITFPKVTTVPASPLFFGRMFFLQLRFTLRSHNSALVEVSLKDVGTAISYATLAAAPISYYCRQYGPNGIAVCSEILSFDATLPDTRYTDSDLRSWVDAIALQKELSSNDCVVVLNPQGVVNRDADPAAGVFGYHHHANLPYIFVNLLGRGLTVADREKFYAETLSHEMAEMVVDPLVNFANPEVCDPCAGNCQRADVGYFEESGEYVSSRGEGRPLPPPFPYAFFISAIVSPAGARDCPSSNENCFYAPVTTLTGLTVNNSGQATVLWLDQSNLSIPWQMAGFDPPAFPAGAPVSNIVQQTGSIIVALAITNPPPAAALGQVAVIWLDESRQPERWRVNSIGLAAFQPGNRVTTPFWLTDTILIALAIGTDPFVAKGQANLIVLDQSKTPQEWEVYSFGPAIFPQGASVTDLIRQTDTIVCALTITEQGQAAVIWFDQSIRQWQVSAFGPPVLQPSARVTDIVRQTDTILAALTVAQDGRATVLWLDLASTPLQWQVASFGPAIFPTDGCWVTDVVRQTDTILCALAVASDGKATVIWLDQSRQPQQWRVAPFGPPIFAGGRQVTNIVRQTDNILAALAVADKDPAQGQASVIWLDQSRRPQHWQVASFGPPNFPPLAAITSVARQHSAILAALAVDRFGLPNVIWLDQSRQPQQWRVNQFGTSGLPAGAAVTDLFHG